MTSRPSDPQPVEHYRERHTPPVMVVVALFLVGVAFVLGPVQFVSIVLRGHEPMWSMMIPGAIGVGVFFAALVAIYNYFTIVIVDDQSIRCLDRKVPLEQIRGLVDVEGKELRRLRNALGSGMARSRSIAPPWMRVGIFIHTHGQPLLIGSRHPQQLIAALETAARRARPPIRGDLYRPRGGQWQRWSR